jgi:hypothetical protein
MSDSTFAVVTTIAIVAGLAAWPVFLDGCAVWAERYRLQRFFAQIEAIDIDSFRPEGVTLDLGL